MYDVSLRINRLYEARSLIDVLTYDGAFLSQSVQASGR